MYTRDNAAKPAQHLYKHDVYGKYLTESQRAIVKRIAEIVNKDEEIKEIPLMLFDYEDLLNSVPQSIKFSQAKVILLYKGIPISRVEGVKVSYSHSQSVRHW